MQTVWCVFWLPAFETCCFCTWRTPDPTTRSLPCRTVDSLKRSKPSTAYPPGCWLCIQIERHRKLEKAFLRLRVWRKLLNGIRDVQALEALCENFFICVHFMWTYVVSLLILYTQKCRFAVISACQTFLSDSLKHLCDSSFVEFASRSSVCLILNIYCICCSVTQNLINRYINEAVVLLKP